MKKTYIIPQAWVLDTLETAILTGSGELSDGGEGTPGAHTESKIANNDFDADFDDEEDDTDIHWQ